MTDAPTIGQLAGAVKLRPAVAADLHFIQDTWLKGYALSKWAKAIPRGAYVEGQLRRMTRLLAVSEVTMVCVPSDDNTLIGYIVTESHNGRFIVHWAYVKQAWRRLGVLRLLLVSGARTHKALEYTHQTDKAKAVGRVFGAVFNPYAAEAS